MKDDYYLPLLFANRDEPVFVVIDDYLLFYAGSWDASLPFVPYCAYNFLLKLFHSPLKDEVIPEALRKHFIGKKPLIDEYDDPSDYYPCLVVQLTYIFWSGFMCIQNDLNITPNKDKPIVLDNFSLLRKEGFKFPEDNNKLFEDGERLNNILANLKVELTPKETFLLFANICISNFYYDIYDLCKAAFIHQKKIGHKDSRFKIVSLFARDYLDWLEEEFHHKRIDPKTILQLNGCNVLSYFLENPRVQDLMYETMQKLQNYTKLSKRELLLYYTFYIQDNHEKYFNDLKRWGKVNRKLKKTEPISPEDIQKIDEMFDNMRLGKL